MQIALIYAHDCPHIAAARRQLLQAFQILGMTPRWREWEHSDPDFPAALHGYGSPSIVIDGRDVDDQAPGDRVSACRVYRQADGRLQGVPPVAQIVARLQQGAAAEDGQHLARSSRITYWAALPTLGVALLPKLVCPFCWPFYASVLSALGLGFIDYTPYLLPLLVVFLGLFLGPFIYRAWSTREYGLVTIAMLAAFSLLLGKFILEVAVLAYLGIGLLIVAIVWQWWSLRWHDNDPCPRCNVNDVDGSFHQPTLTNPKS